MTIWSLKAFLSFLKRAGTKTLASLLYVRIKTYPLIESPKIHVTLAETPFIILSQGKRRREK